MDTQQQGLSRPPDAIDRSWRQGAVLPAEYLGDERKSLRLTSELTEDCVIVILSHSCDLLSEDLSAEPAIELLVGRRVPPEKQDSTALDGKHVRRYQFTWPETAIRYEFSAAEKSIVARKILVGRAAPDKCLPPEVMSKVAAWAGKRYTRPAFPDAFELRRKSAVKKIAKLAERHAELIAHVFVRLNTSRELAECENYSVRFLVVAKDDAIDNGPNEKKVWEFARELEIALSNCEGILVDETRVISDMKFPIALLRVWQKFDFDYLSYPSDPDTEASTRTC